MKNIYTLRQIIASVIICGILIWLFFNNQLLGKIVIIPFLICSIATFLENLFILLKKENMVNIFRYIFRLSFFSYIFGFLIFATSYALNHKDYILFIITGIFAVFSIHLFIVTFFKKK